MCGRYAFTHSTQDIEDIFDLHPPEGLDLEPRYNIAPTELVPVVYRNRSGERALGRARWGLVPSWVRDPADWKAATFNARSEEVANKPAFRNAFRRGRVLIPATGFFEWKEQDGEKQPYFVRYESGAPLVFAGLMEVWRSKAGDGQRLVSCTILTTAAQGKLEELHHRMPVLVPDGLWDTWLTEEDSGRALEATLGNSPAQDVEIYPVSRHVNSTRFQEPTCIDRLAQA